MVVRVKLFSPLTLCALVVVLVTLISRPALANAIVTDNRAVHVIDVVSRIQADVCRLNRTGTVGDVVQRPTGALRARQWFRG